MLDINPIMMLIVFVVFIGTLSLLKKWYFLPMQEFMDQRDESIRKDLENTRSNSDEIDALYAEADSALVEAKKEATKIRESAMAAVNQALHDAVEEKKQAMEKEYAKFMEELGGERSNLKNSLLSQVPLYRESLKAKISQL